MPSEEIKNLKIRYKNGQDRIGRDLIGPCLKECRLYRRGTGTFTSSALTAYVGAIDHMLKDDVKVQILCSPKIDRNLIEILQKVNSTTEKEKTIRALADKIVLTAIGYELNPLNIEYRSKLLAYFIANEIIEIKFAIPIDLLANDMSGLVSDDISIEELETRNMYHVKLGYFVFPDKESSVVAFDGSANESDSAHHHNTERTQVFRSWIPSDAERLSIIKEDLDEDWNEKNSHIKVFRVSSETLRLIKLIAPERRPINKEKNTRPSGPISNNSADDVSPEPNVDELDLRTYQKVALEKWKENSYQGILAMATGTGKTRTAIQALVNFREAFPSGFIIVVVPYLNLATQWIAEIQKVGINSIPVFDNWGNWYAVLQNSCFAAGLDKTPAPCIVAVENTFKSERFQELMNVITDAQEKNHLLIADECHHFNNLRQIATLPKFFKFRLGLSATPYDIFKERYLDGYFKGIVYEFTLAEAIAKGYLCPYEYHVVTASLNQEETVSYEEITRRIVAIVGAEDKITPENFPMIQPLLLRRARIVGTAANKMVKLRELLTVSGKQQYALVYCGDGSNENNDGGADRQLDQVTQLLHSLNWNVSRVTSVESYNERNQLIDALKNRLIDAIVSIKVLDEGIDIPSCRIAYFMASQRSERQGIQRRGRVLRLSDGKKKAVIYDFVVTGTMTNSLTSNALIKKELERVWRFASDAINGISVKESFKALAESVGLTEGGLEDVSQK